MTGIMDGAFKACALACIGDWTGRGKTISIAERSGELVLEMGPETPTLQLVPTSSAETWPMQWNATRLGAESKDTIYFIELPTPISPRLLVRRPVGDSVIEFTRVGMELESGNGLVHATGLGGGQQLALIDQRERSRSISRSRSTPGRSRAQSPLAIVDARDGSTGFKPGDWTCRSCNFHNFARNLSCKSCGAAKPKSAGAQDTSGHDALVTRIKRGQRESQTFKQRWWDFCDRKGGGFYDPVRHDTRLLEEFLSSERGGRGGSRSRSRGRSRSRSRSGSSSRSRSRSRRRHRKRKRGKRSKAHRKQKKSHKGRRKKRAKKRKRSKSSHASSAPSSASTAPGMPSRKIAISATERAIEEQRKILEAAKKAVEPVAAEILQEAAEKQKEEVAKKIELARRRVDEEMKQRLRDVEAKLQEDKASQLRESEQKLDAVIASRLKDAEERLRKDADARIEEHMKSITPAVGVEAERKVKAEAAANVQAAESRLQQARAHLASVAPALPTLPSSPPLAPEVPAAEKDSEAKDALALQDGKAESSSSSSSSSSTASEAEQREEQPEPVDASATVLR